MSEEKTKMMTPHLRSGTWYAELQKNGRIKNVVISPEMRQILGYGSEEELPATMKGLLNHIHPDDRDEILELAIAATTSGSMFFDLGLRLQAKDGSYIPVSATVKLIRLPEGAPYMLHGIVVDVAGLDASEPEEDAANNTNSAMIFNISNKMLPPMNTIMDCTNMLENHLKDDQARDYIQKIRDSHSFLMSLISNVLGMTRLESGMVVLEESYQDVYRLMKSISAEFKGPMKEKKIKFTTNVNVEHPNIMVDFTKVKEILLNVIGNAHKYTPSGGRVNVTVRELPHEKPEYALYQTTISDTGIGIAKDAIPHLYDAFSRTSTAHDGVLGTGLGMHIVKELVTLLGGTIEVNSIPGKGTDFIITIPHRIAMTGSNGDGEADGDDSQPMRILMAEDNELNADIAISLLEERGFIVDRVEDGAKCVDKLKKSQRGYYDIVLMDVQMPKMDGYQATNAIRKLKDPVHSTIPIIAMTANASDADKREALLQGMNAHTAKPFDMDRLYATIFNVLEHKDYYIQSDGLEKFKKKYTKLGCRCGFFVYRVDWDEKIIFADQGTAEIFGCANEEEFIKFVNGTFKTMVHADDIEHVQKAIDQQQAYSAANIDLVDYDIIRKDGAIRHLADIGYKVFNGEELVYFVYIADITDVTKK